MTKMRYETDFNRRMRQLITDAWEIFQNKVGNGHLEINKEASMQLHYAYILNSLLPHYIFSHDETATLELETGVKVNGTTKEIDLLLQCSKAGNKNNIAIEMKCYKEYASSGGKRGATDIFMKDVYYDLHLLEQYCQQSDPKIHAGIELVMTDLERLIYPKSKDAKCWDYDISHGTQISNISLNTPIGGKDVNFAIKKQHDFIWVQNGSYWFTIIEGID